MAAAIQARDLTKTFPPGTVAVSGLDLEIEPGTVYGLIGRNGAGKTTTLRLLMGLLRPDRGEARVHGEELWRASQRARARIGYVSQSQHLPGWMTLQELCRYCRSFYPNWDQTFAEHLAERWDLPFTRPIGSFSGGEQRKAAVLLSLAPTPDVLLLDEPAGGLDPLSRREVLDEIVQVLNRGSGTTILFSTHFISDLERVADWIGILDRGRLLMSRPLDDLQSSFRRIQVIFPGEVVPPHFSIPGATRSTVCGPVASAITEYFAAEQLENLRAWPGVRVQTFPVGLEEIFIEKTGDLPRSHPTPADPEPEFETMNTFGL